MIFAWVLAGAIFLVPGRDHAVLARAIADVVDAEPALFKNDPDKRKTAALVLAVAFRESSLNNDAVGDNGHSTCAMQIYDGGQSLREDPKACIKVGLAMLRQSVKADPGNPVAFYARGPGYKSEEAKRISRDRMAIAQRLVKGVRLDPP